MLMGPRNHKVAIWGRTAAIVYALLEVDGRVGSGQERRLLRVCFWPRACKNSSSKLKLAWLCEI